jgi:RNA polymerase sigma-70 factor, ECF subfamily
MVELPDSFPAPAEMSRPSPRSDEGRVASENESSFMAASGTLSGSQLAELLVQHFPKAWRVACRLGLSQAQAEEVAQEAFVVLLNRLSQLERGRELSFLLATVAKISQNVRRKASHFREIPSTQDVLESHTVGTTAHEIVEQKQACRLVDEILAHLSSPLRVVFVLYEIERFTLQEIAVTLGIPLGTAASRLRLARQAFEKMLEHQRLRERFPMEEP